MRRGSRTEHGTPIHAETLRGIDMGADRYRRIRALKRRRRQIGQGRLARVKYRRALADVRFNDATVGEAIKAAMREGKQ